MKKFVLVLVAAVFACTSLNAQILRAEELEKYAKEKYGEKWVDAAKNLGSQLALDKNNAITYTQIIPVHIPVDTRSPIPVISVQSVGDLQYRRQS